MGSDIVLQEPQSSMYLQEAFFWVFLNGIGNRDHQNVKLEFNEIRLDMAGDHESIKSTTLDTLVSTSGRERK
jgi:hypothetical protein